MIINSKAIPLLAPNIDTDQIIPAQFLKSTTKEGFGKNLFHHWRYNSDGSENEDFVLNKTEYKGLNILIAGNNFGCGSSREHAAWALKDFGIDAVISTQFADIFKLNAYNNQILPIELDEAVFDEIVGKISEEPNSKIEVNLEKQTMKLSSENDGHIFSISPFHKDCLLNDLDETAYLINLKSEIVNFERNQ